MVSHLKRVIPVLAVLLLSLDSAAGAADRAFVVNITLDSRGGPAVVSGICTSQSWSERTGALVQVACANGQFVSIGPRSGARYAGSHGGAYTYRFSPGSDYRLVYDSARSHGAGTVTTYRVYTVDDTVGLLDLLVSF